MRKTQKKDILDILNSLQEAHEEIKEALAQKNHTYAQDMLAECQIAAVSLGETIEKSEGEGHICVLHLEEYCELLFQVYEDINSGNLNDNKASKTLRRQLIKIENSVKNDIAIRKEVVFFPYKASMWDSLESIYLAAKADPDCDAYCVPIPYYDLNPDHSFGQMHYEGGEYPKEIEITDWQTYNFEERKPDVIYIHNPYDNYNLVTSVHPWFYSSNLKKYTDTLVYVPYYISSGGMIDGMGFCPSYMNTDYIVIQSPKFREHYDGRIPDEKFLPFGSPKADRVIKKCQNPPVRPKEWQEKMAEKKVYFYNTSINGMLADTENFLKKMQYVFNCFKGRGDACILWRPHPLLEATFHSMRPQYWPVFEKLQKQYVENGIGILDTTADIEDSIALSDAYIGDAATSVRTLFGVVGKPIFILDNKIHSELMGDSWLEEMDIRYGLYGNSRFAITQGDKLYLSEPGKYEYKYFCDLSEHTRANHYSWVYEIDGKYYVCPQHAQNILVVGGSGVEKIIKLDEKIEVEIEGSPAFSCAWKYDKYLLLIPFNYPSVVRYDTTTGQIRYFDVKYKNGQSIVGNSLIYQDELYIASPKDNQICKLHIESGEIQIIELPIQSRCGCFQLAEYRDEIWLMPCEGKVIVRWNPLTGETREYFNFPPAFTCIDPVNRCEGPAFNLPAFYGEYIYLAPGWANMYLKLNINTGEFAEWKPSFDGGSREVFTSEKSTFLYKDPNEQGNGFTLYSYARRKLYSIDDMEAAECKETRPVFDIEELKMHDPGFCECSGSLRYACKENYFVSLEGFLNGKTGDSRFDKDRELAAYREILANYDGDCGQKIHEFIKKQK